MSPRPKFLASNSRGRRVESTAHLTSTPIKDKLEQRKEMQTKKQVHDENKAAIHKTCGKKTAKRKANKTRTLLKKTAVRKVKKKRCTDGEALDSCSEEEWPCLICAELFSNLKANEVWVRCDICRKCTHDECTKGEDIFVCPNCESDDSF